MPGLALSGRLDTGIPRPRSLPLVPPEPFPARDRRLFRGLAFLLGFTLPLLTLQTGYYGTPKDLASRVAVADFVCLLMFALLLLRGSPARVPIPGGLYGVSLLLSLVPALLIWPGPEDFVWTTVAGIGMAFAFYLLGLSIGESREVTTALLGGLALVTVAEFAIVLHDVVATAQWFPDPMEGRARGTFKANGQLGAFGFCAAGLLLVLSGIPESGRLRGFCVLSGLLAASFVVTASRRTGMISVFLWALCFAVLGARFIHRRFYQVFLAVFILLLVGAGVSWGTLTRSFAGQRLSEGLSTLSASDSFIRNQHEHILASAGDWFPLGFGPGRGNRIDLADPEHHEIHNGLLAVLVELGVLGFLGFVGIVIHPWFGGAARPRTDDADLRRWLLRSFLLVIFIFMAHNTLYRDRTFLLFLGMVTSLRRRESVRPRPRPEALP
ncbi:MAG TPA: hypothetical protein VKW04_02915 [Planctomycetota bacterium]|nr:hypothetical protein [Planctomycetota bacterium]